MELVLISITCLLLAVALYLTIVRIGVLKSELKALTDSVMEKQKRDLDKREEIVQMINNLYDQQFNIRAKIILLMTEVERLEQRRPFPRKQKGRR
ncbi:hypothetical protein JXA27_09830 [Aerococcaceae bacterium zg-B36]|uniref:hypothetical protein n=1 Tax=Aerococcaceae bacterium zg-252 TaxID=2796928 RepID=UPI001BD85802|nr:hypothetical protein [Aerococcaceae bacterium zg-B36]